jgi:hypothetical protein
MRVQILTELRSGRKGGFHRRNTSRCKLAGRALLRYATKASPTSWQKGRLRSRRFFPARISTHPRPQSISSIRKRITSQARNPNRANKSAMARSRNPLAEFGSEAAMMRSTLSTETALGSVECRQVRTEGTAPASPAGTTPALVKKRKNARMAVTGCPQLTGCSFAASR